MAVSRRRFLESAAGIGAASTAAALYAPPPTLAATPAATVSTPPVEIIALNRMGYGPRAGDPARVKQLGLNAYITEQLNPVDSDDPLFLPQLAAARIKIKYNAGDGYAARNEAVPLDLLNLGVKDLWSRANYQNKQDYQERMLPWYQVRVATWLRAIYSKWQLREVMVEFWHDHFNVNAPSDAAISVGFPDYDRIMRQNWNGNFRTMLEAVAKSTAMMHYLDNKTNKAGGGEAGNENYARELFELHTLGSDNYLKFYKDRRKIGTVSYNGEAFARGYIDDDVYYAADCFTGWTIGRTHWELPQSVPDDGQFYYFANWHTTADKNVLSPDGFPNIPRNQPDLKDGTDVLDLTAYHIGTAQHLCKKLCVRLIADEPSQALVDAAVAAWMANRQKPDQIKQVLQVILSSNEFKTTWGRKVKRPFESLVSYLRAVNADMAIDAVSAKDDKGNDDPNRGGHWNDLLYRYAQTGHRRFEWPTPTGHPDYASHWLTTNGMLWRWNLPYNIIQSWGGNVKIDLVGQTDLNASCVAIVDAWIDRLCGYTVASATRQGLIDFLAQTANGGNPNLPPTPVKDEYGTAAEVVRDRLNSMVQLLAMSPEFQLR